MKRRNAWLSITASLHVWSARLNQCCTKYIRCSRNRRAAVAGLRVVRLERAAQLGRGHDLLHRRQERVAPRRLAVPLELRVMICGHGEHLLLHDSFNADTREPVSLMSVALNILVAADGAAFEPESP